MLFRKKGLMRALLIFALVQIAIIVLYTYMLNESKPIELERVKQIDITVEEICYKKVISEYRLDIYSDLKKYSFASRGTTKEYSNSELYEIISTGDLLTIVYYEKSSVFGTENRVVEARTKTETYRSFEEYNKGKNGLSVGVTVLFVMIEIVFWGIFAFYFWTNFNFIKSVFRLS